MIFLFWIALQSHWTTVNGHRFYYETMGRGRPLVLLHGGGNNVHGSFDKQIDAFARTHFLIGPEQIGQGHTPDIDAPLTYAAMTSDTAALLDQLHFKDVDIVGWSDGGIIALMLAARRPDLVRRVVVSGANFSPAGYPPDDLRQMLANDKAEPRSFGEKLNHLWAASPTFEELSPAILGHINKRVLVMAGDHDAILLDHTIALYRALPDARLCILPGTGHGTFNERPEWVNPIVLSFLADY
jgi:pimeloyl-ACP methyl ester carboxylesterase